MFVSVQSILPLEWNFKLTFFLLVFRGTKTVKGNDTDASETQRWLSFKYLSSNYFKSCRKAQKSSYFWQYISVDIKLLCFSRMYDKGRYSSGCLTLLTSYVYTLSYHWSAVQYEKIVNSILNQL